MVFRPYRLFEYQQKCLYMHRLMHILSPQNSKLPQSTLRARGVDPAVVHALTSSATFDLYVVPSANNMRSFTPQGRASLLADTTSKSVRVRGAVPL